MTRLCRVQPSLAAALLTTAALVPAGCGPSQKERYVDDYKPLNDRLLRIGVSIGGAPLDRARGSDPTLAKRFRMYASDLDDVKEDIAALDTPADLRDDSKALTDTIDVVVRDLERISRAARQGDRKTAAGATLALAEDSNAVNRAQNNLARVTGADEGPR